MNIPEKKLLRDYLSRRGIKINRNKTLKCPNPAHSDNHPSAVIYDNPDIPVVYCPVCSQSWNVIEVAGLLDNLTEFKDKLKAVRDTLGTAPLPATEKKSEPKKKKEKKPLPFPSEKKETFNKKINEVAAEKGWGEIAGSWKYHNADGDVVALDIRFESEGERKNIITFWYDGSLKWYDAPVFVYGLEKLNPDFSVMIHEGAKCADAAGEISEFIHLSWSGGSGKAHLADWSVLQGREIFIMPDDDDPGIKAAHNIKKQLPQAKIIKPISAARNKKNKGADIIEILQVMTPDQFTEYALNPENYINDSEVCPEPEKPTTEPNLLQSVPPKQIRSLSDEGHTSEPFKILGIGDDGRAAFITEEKRLARWNLDSLSKQKLTVLAGRSYWTSYYPQKGGADWDTAIDDIVRESQKKDFNESCIRGRGAWRDGENLSYHDGVETYGEHDLKKIYLRLPRHDIGINENSASYELTAKIKSIVFRMSFETPADAVRCLGWSVLAPFAGALKYRPALLLTGPSGSGKTTVANLCIRKLANCEWFNGSESTVAGVRGKIRYDSCGVMFEEIEADTMKKKTNRDELFSLMRVNVSDDAPDTVKGTKEGGYNSFKMQNMFGFIAIDPTVESVADENRIFRVNMIKPVNGSEWKNIEADLISHLNEHNCRTIRALTWQKLKTVLTLADKIVDAIRGLTGRDYRSSFSDAMLAAAFMVIWGGAESPSESQINEMLTKYYQYQPAEEHRDEAGEVVERIMDETIEILGDGGREKITIMECLNRIYTGEVMSGFGIRELTEKEISNYKLHAARYGVRITDDCNIAIANRHHAISKIIERGSGYNKILKRHKGFIESQRSVHFYDGGAKRCTIIRGVLKLKKEDKTDDEKLEDLIV